MSEATAGKVSGYGTGITLGRIYDHENTLTLIKKKKATPYIPQAVTVQSLHYISIHYMLTRDELMSDFSLTSVNIPNC